MQIRNEILEDFENYCDGELKKEFTSYSRGNYDPVYLYERYKCRIIEPRPRKVAEARNFSCPSMYQGSYIKIKSDIESGNHLKKYQSRKLKTLDYDDDMLSHWGIQHLHLGSKVEADGFVERTGDLLFVFFKESHAYIVGIYDHKGWTDLGLIQVIHDNWPYELTVYQSNTNNKTMRLTSENYKTLRRKGANSTVTVSNGTEYIAPGFGVTCNKAPISAVFNTDRLIFEFNKAFEVIQSNIQLILDSDPQQRTSDSLTIGFFGLDANKTAIYNIKETGFKFTLSS